MNITYIIGNGFDLNLGLPTRYDDFYEYYVNEPSANPNVELLKQTITEERYTLWSDLELGLGAISSRYTKRDDFMEALEDVSEHLRTYIATVNNGVQIEQYDTERFRKDLCTPSKYLVEADRLQFRTHCKRFTTAWHVNIISFNYTDIIERLLSPFWTKRQSSIGSNEINNTTFIDSLQYVHGGYDDTILVGVNDESQIANVKFREEILLQEMFVKPQANEAIGELIDAKCCAYLNASQVICVFGHSMGKTDAVWWDRIRKILAERDCRLIVFAYDKTIDIRHRKFARPHVKRELMARLGWDNAIEGKIYVGLNTDIFKLHRE